MVKVVETGLGILFNISALVPHVVVEEEGFILQFHYF